MTSDESYQTSHAKILSAFVMSFKCPQRNFKKSLIAWRVAANQLQLRKGQAPRPITSAPTNDSLGKTIVTPIVGFDQRPLKIVFRLKPPAALSCD